jgi:hypothetical protein
MPFFKLPIATKAHVEEHRILTFTRTPVRQTDNYCYIHDYHPYRRGGERNPQFDRAISGKILDLKDGNDDAIKHFVPIIGGIIYTKVSLFVVPSSNPSNQGSGIRKLAKALVGLGHWDDQTANLYRKYKIDKYATGGTRDPIAQYNSLGLRSPESVKGANALILDDVTTTGTSFNAAKRLLLEAGATRVYCLALGKTA